MKRLYSTAAALVLAGALVLPTATSAQAANSDLTVSVTLSVYNKGSVGKAFDIYDRSKQIDEGNPSRMGTATTASNSRRVITSLDAQSSRPSKVEMPSGSTIR